MINKHDQIYVTDATLKLRQSQKQKNRNLLEECRAINELGQEYIFLCKSIFFNFHEYLEQLFISLSSIDRGQLFA